MNPAGTHFQLLPAAVKNLDKRAVGKLRPVSLGETGPAAFTALDCFDQSLRVSGRLLLETEAGFELLRDGEPAILETVPGSPRFIADFPEGPLKQALAGFPALRSLLPVGAGTLQRATVIFVDGEGKTHCRAKLLKLESEQGRSVQLVELQGVRGYAKSLSQVRAHLGSLGGAPAGCAALYSLLFPTLAAYEARPDIALSGTETAFEAATKIIAAGLPVLRANEPGIIADHDTEFLHDYRVQIRKIRSVLSLFKGVYDDQQTAELKKRFSALAAPTGRLRDLDVYLLQRDSYRKLLPESLRPGLDALFDIFSRQRSAEQRDLARHLRSSAYKREIAALEKRFKRSKELSPGIHAGQSAHDYACERIWQHYRKVRKAALEITPDTPDDDIHELRIRCKKLRYLIEFFSPVFPRPALAKLLKPLKRLQENLGLFNDYSVQQESLQAFLAEPTPAGEDSGLEIAQSVGALIAILHNMQLEERTRIMEQLARFNRPAVQQTFSDLFQKNRKDHT